MPAAPPPSRLPGAGLWSPYLASQLEDLCGLVCDELDRRVHRFLLVKLVFRDQLCQHPAVDTPRHVMARRYGAERARVVAEARRARESGCLGDSSSKPPDGIGSIEEPHRNPK